MEKKPNNKGRKNPPRNTGFNDGVTLAWGENLYKDEIKKRTYKHISDYLSACNKCQEGSEMLIDLTVIVNHQYNYPGDFILGDLEQDG